MVSVDLEYRTDTLVWELFALVIDTGSGEPGDHGLAAVRALIDNIDFGTNGDAVNIASGIGAIDPIDEGGANERPAVLQTAGGTLDLVYGQDISDPLSVVGGVGVGSRALIAGGTFPAADTPPAFGDDDRGSITDGNFLNVPPPGPFGVALPWDSVTLNVLDVSPGDLAGDYNSNGVVDASDYTVWRNNLGSTVTLPGDTTPGTVTQTDYDIWKVNFGNTASSFVSAASAAIPEPASALLVIMSAAVVCLHRGSHGVL